jgi:hypothetical protein
MTRSSRHGGTAPTSEIIFMERSEPRPENMEKKKYRYTYRDNSAGGKIIFECVAESILDADEWYEKETGKNPEKQNHVGCSVEEIKDKEK